MTRTRPRTRAPPSPHNRPVPVIVIPTKQPRQKPARQLKPKKPPICKVVVPKLPSMSKKPPHSHSRLKDPSAGSSHADIKPTAVPRGSSSLNQPQPATQSDDDLDDQSTPDPHSLDLDTRSESAQREPDRLDADLMEPPLGSQPSESTLEYVDQPPSSSPVPDQSQFHLPSLAPRSSGYDAYDHPGHVDHPKRAMSRSSSLDSGHTAQPPHNTHDDESGQDDRYSIPLDRYGLPVSTQRRPPASSDGSDPFGFSKAERVLQEYRAKGHTLQLAAHEPQGVRQQPRNDFVQRDVAGRKPAEGTEAQLESDLSLTDLLPIFKPRRAGKSRSEKKSDGSLKRTRKRYPRATKADVPGSSGDENSKWAKGAVARSSSEQRERDISRSPTQSPRSGRARRASSSGRLSEMDPRSKRAQVTRKPLMPKRMDPNRKSNKTGAAGEPSSKSSKNHKHKRQASDSLELEQAITPPDRKKRLEYFKELEEMEFEEEVVI